MFFAGRATSRSRPRGSRSTAIGLDPSFHQFGGSLGSILPVPGWHRFGWRTMPSAGCEARTDAGQRAG
ncbi:hypothetical protein WI42_26510 [Burkholderia ubonensis]|nr:hypothetical protein WI31_22445 [Burkholderia ubonensis]KUZ11851.1 hypothetical protein WI29_28605 [Burkholderia ubonensis]KUZ35716.1 hypothetical protein WI30_11520 [Burkholderia ubonensis]KUZ39244.1 hypothetical protein WI32_11560 [Burkholderia ubonensis]KUZ45704.1 hypothetical protein WI33_27300 [Burkholderia ubonensis]